MDIRGRWKTGEGARRSTIFLILESSDLESSDLESSDPEFFELESLDLKIYFD
jgi:hypothetical protein